MAFGQALEDAFFGIPPLGIVALLAIAGVFVYIALKVPMVWTIARFGYSNALYNSRINRFARKIYLNNLLGTGTFLEALNFVSSASPGDYPLKNVKTVEEAERLLFETLYGRVEEAKVESPKMIAPVLDTFIIRYENRALKSVFRERLESGSGIGVAVIPVGKVTAKVMERMRAVENVGDMIGDVPREDLAAMLRDRELNTMHDVENALDSYYIQSLERSFRKLPRAIRSNMKELLEIQIDIVNIKLLLRMIKLGIPEKNRRKYIRLVEGKNVHGEVLEKLVGAETVVEAVDALGRTPYGPLLREVFKEYKSKGSISAFELELDKFWIAYVENFAMKMNTTVGPVIRYLVEMEYEVRNITTVLRSQGVPGGDELARSLIVCREVS